jgi:hypothetical protein
MTRTRGSIGMSLAVPAAWCARPRQQLFEVSLAGPIRPSHTHKPREAQPQPLLLRQREPSGHHHSGAPLVGTTRCGAPSEPTRRPRSATSSGCGGPDPLPGGSRSPALCPATDVAGSTPGLRCPTARSGAVRSLPLAAFSNSASALMIILPSSGDIFFLAICLTTKRTERAR